MTWQNRLHHVHSLCSWHVVLTAEHVPSKREKKRKKNRNPNCNQVDVCRSIRAPFSEEKKREKDKRQKKMREKKTVQIPDEWSLRSMHWNSTDVFEVFKVFQWIAWLKSGATMTITASIHPEKLETALIPRGSQPVSSYFLRYQTIFRLNYLISGWQTSSRRLISAWRKLP